MTAWYASRYTGLFTQFGAVPPRPHDPRLAVWAGAASSLGGQELHVGGVGWDSADAEAACVGEAVERLAARPLADDQVVTASLDEWPLDEPACPNDGWVMFHPEQYRQLGFPFEPLTPRTRCAWVCCRRADTGEPCWAPAELIYLHAGTDQAHHLCAGVSTGLACGRAGHPLVLRGLQEVVERDAVLGAWWGRYALEEFAIGDVLDGLRRDARERLLRLNLTYRCYRIRGPYGDHVALATLAGDDREGWCFSVGSACRETAAAAWEKALLEAVHGRHYVRHLRREAAEGRLRLGRAPGSFAEHAVWYSLRPRELSRTVLGMSQPRGADPFPAGEESAARIMERLGESRPVLFRSMTAPALASSDLGWHVVRVVVPGLQPLHGSHDLAHLGGPLWAPRALAEWRDSPPHPFP